MTGFQEQTNNAITNLRNSMQMSQEKFSEKCGISVDGYRNLEYNRYMPKASTIDKICSAFNLTPTELLNYAMEKPPICDEIITSLSSLSDKQLAIVNDFIKMIRQYSIL